MASSAKSESFYCSLMKTGSL